ncbi:hypothetical protein AVEN_65695-1 [Araneus ventricosus]|uniref:Uncharacterized protein n=1 Tax=Araneus ventricosus TaxID=182803 RepID=A0A4Y2PX40_ARAVE|nr:hypothetical protein AVEN_65695-1 [Araneus ventricosus]
MATQRKKKTSFSSKTVNRTPKLSARKKEKPFEQQSSRNQAVNTGRKHNRQTRKKYLSKKIYVQYLKARKDSRRKKNIPLEETEKKVEIQL